MRSYGTEALRDGSEKGKGERRPMTRSSTSLAVLSALALAAAVAPAARAADTCPNASFRTGPSATLPDCRAYELVTPDLNHASLGLQPAGQVTPDGNTMVYQTIDAPDRASSASVFDFVRARRDPATGWHGASLSPPLSHPTNAFQGFFSYALSADLSSTFEDSEQPLSGGSVPAGQNSFIGRPDGTFQLLTLVGTPLLTFLHVYTGTYVAGASPDFSHLYIVPAIAQLPSDPLPGLNTYSWSQDEGLRLIGILPDGTLAPGGASFAGASDDGRYVAFTAEGELYLRTDESHTVRAGVTQRTVDPDPNPVEVPVVVAVTASGSKILFTSRSELTNDANTGEAAGVADDAGRDLYSYDTATGLLTDLTADPDPADRATGADVRVNGNESQFVRSTADGSYVYFTASGNLAPGATSGHRSLFVSHEGHVQFVAKADGINDENRGIAFYMTPDGRHVAFASSESLTGYDNRDPLTAQPHSEVFEATIGQGLLCASCRVDSTPPTGDSTVPVYTGLGPGGSARVISDDGARVFFQSTDALVPGASSSFPQVFEYSGASIGAISNPDGSSASDFLSASSSGDDAFFATYDELVPYPDGGDQTVFDARVNGGFPIPSQTGCSGAACHGTPPPPPALSTAASLSFSPSAQSETAPGKPRAKARVTVSRIATVTGTVGLLKINAPGSGRVTVSGSALRARRVNVSRAQVLTVRLALTKTAARTLRKRGSLKARAIVQFTDPSGNSSTARIPLTFRARTPRAGHPS